MLPDLLDDAAELVDLESVWVTEQPSAPADLLTRVAADDALVTTSWQIAHLWFARRECERSKPYTSGRIEAPALARRCERGSTSALRARANAATRRAGTHVSRGE